MYAGVFFFSLWHYFLAEDESINTRLDANFWVACSIYLYLANIYVIDLTFKVEGYTKILFFMDRQSIILRKWKTSLLLKKISHLRNLDFRIMYQFQTYIGR